MHATLADTALTVAECFHDYIDVLVLKHYKGNLPGKAWLQRGMTVSRSCTPMCMACVITATLLACWTCSWACIASRSFPYDQNEIFAVIITLSLERPSLFERQTVNGMAAGNLQQQVQLVLSIMAGCSSAPSVVLS